MWGIEIQIRKKSSKTPPLHPPPSWRSRNLNFQSFCVQTNFADISASPQEEAVLEEDCPAKRLLPLCWRRNISDVTARFAGNVVVVSSKKRRERLSGRFVVPTRHWVFEP